MKQGMMAKLSVMFRPTGLAALIVAVLLPALRAGAAADPYASRYEAPAAGTIVITGARLLDGAGAQFNDVDVQLAGGKIVAIGRKLDSPPGARVIDATGRWVTPGLIDVHSHDGTYTLPLTPDGLSDITELGSWNSAGTWIEHAIDTDDPAFRYALASGVTTVQVMPGSATLFGGRTVVVKPVSGRTIYDVKFPEARRGLKIACGENAKSHSGGGGSAPTSRQGELANLRKAFREARDWLAEHPDADARALAISGDPVETLAAVLLGFVPVHAHCYRADDIANLLALGREFGFRYAAIHHATEAYRIPKVLLAADTCTAVWADWWGYKLEALDAVRANAGVLHAAGACVAIHSDSPEVGRHLNIEAAKAMAAAARADIEIGRAEAVRWITSNPARILGLDDRIGRIAAGYNADIVVWSGDPFSIYSRADLVFIDGIVRFDRRRTSADEFARGGSITR